MYHSGVPKRFRAAGFRNFKGETENRCVAVRLAERYAKEITAKDRGAFSGGYWLHGLTGRGKTHLLCAQITLACKWGVRGHYMTWRQLVDSIFSDKHGQPPKLPGHQDAKTSALLALDKVCAVRDTEWEKGLFSELIDRRYSEGLPTIFAAGAPPEELNSILGATLSQITSVVLTLPLDGPDYRQVEVCSNRDSPAFPIPETPTKDITYASPPTEVDIPQCRTLVEN